MSFIDIKYCKKCKKAFDIGTNYDICPECRGLIKGDGGNETKTD